MIRGDFEFHPIGQGCFYTGNIRSNHAQFNFVYDCGTLSPMHYLNDEIDRYKPSLPSNTLDLLIISHFDKDHVNGVVRLLDRIHCKRIIIPYYEPIERLLLYVKSGSTDQDYRMFLQDPISFLSSSRFDVGEMLVVGGPGNDFNNTEREEPTQPVDDNTNKLELNLEDEKDYDQDMVIERVEKLEGNSINHSTTKFLKSNRVFISYIWEFKFYLKQRDEDALIESFKSGVNELLICNKISIKNLFEDPYKGEVKKLYGKFDSDLNETSLVTYHEPLQGNRESYFVSFNTDFYKCRCQNKYGTLLTGDINLKKKTTLDDLSSHYVGYLDKVCVFQVPHHGSANNWPFRHKKYLEEFCFYVINHGLGRRSHPSSGVIKCISKDFCKTEILNNEITQVEYHIEI